MKDTEEEEAESRSTWACELKFSPAIRTVSSLHVTLHVSVWVEIQNDTKIGKNLQSHAPRERVSWNCWQVRRTWFLQVTLHVSVWVEISHHIITEFGFLVTLHVSVWVEIAMQKFRCEMPDGHAPRERVSWNWSADVIYRNASVTLHVSVWVEIFFQ